jgi:hypothetical protein
MVIKKGVTEIPDSEDEPLSSSPVRVSEKDGSYDALKASEDVLDGAVSEAKTSATNPSTATFDHNEGTIVMQNILQDIDNQPINDSQHVVNPASETASSFKGPLHEQNLEPVETERSLVKEHSDLHRKDDAGIKQEDSREAHNGMTEEPAPAITYSDPAPKTARHPPLNREEEVQNFKDSGVVPEEGGSIIHNPSHTQSESTREDNQASTRSPYLMSASSHAPTQETVHSTDDSTVDQTTTSLNRNGDTLLTTAITNAVTGEAPEQIEVGVDAKLQEQHSPQTEGTTADIQEVQFTTAEKQSLATTSLDKSPLQHSSPSVTKRTPDLLANVLEESREDSVEEQKQPQADRMETAISEAEGGEQTPRKFPLPGMEMRDQNIPADPGASQATLSQPASATPQERLKMVSNALPKPSTPAKPSQETTLAELKAQRTALIAALAALPQIQELIAEDESSPVSSEASDSGPTDAEVMAAANKVVKKHIKLLHEYNEIKDVGQGLMGLIADQRGVRIVEVQDEFGIGEKD